MSSDDGETEEDKKAFKKAKEAAQTITKRIIQKDVDKAQENATKRVAAGKLVRQIAKDLSRTDNLTEEKKEKIVKEAASLKKAKQVGQELADRQVREVKEKVQREVTEAQKNAQQRVKAGNKAKEIAKEMSKDDGQKASRNGSTSTTSFTGTGRTVVRQASTGADDSQLRGRTRKRGNSVSRDRSRSREPRSKQRGDESDGTSGDRSDMGTSGDSSDSRDSGSSSDDDDSREKNDYSSMLGYIKPQNTSRHVQLHMIETNGTDGLKPYKQGGKTDMFKFINNNRQIEVMRGGKYTRTKTTYDNLPQENIRWRNEDTGKEGILLITNGSKKSAKNSTQIISEYKRR